MVRGRFVLIGIAAVVVLALIFGAVSNNQRDAWTQGYLIGRLTAVEGDAALAPVGAIAPYAYAYPQRGPGFGGFLFLLLGIGGVIFIGSRFARMTQWRAWAAQQGMTPEGQPKAPWGGPPMGWGCGGHHQRQQQAPPAQGEAQPSAAEAGER